MEEQPAAQAADIGWGKAGGQDLYPQGIQQVWECCTNLAIRRACTNECPCTITHPPLAEDFFLFKASFSYNLSFARLVFFYYLELSLS